MEKIAFINGGTFTYWSSVIMTLAVITAIAVFAAMYLNKGGSFLSLCVLVPAAMTGSLLLSRLLHWYCRSDAYESFHAAMNDFSRGGYALMGAFIACIGVAALLRLIRVVEDLPGTYDCMAIGGGMGIAVGRLASLFNASDRGGAVSDALAFPFAYPITNSVSGELENRLATFMIQSFVAGGIVAALLLFMLICRLAKKKIPSGDVALLFLLVYGASQIVCDSTRYDSLFLRSNGFISLVQILGLVALLIPIFVFSWRMVRSRGLKGFQFAIWVVMLALMGGAGYMEYHVQRHGNEAVFAYSVMSGCLAGVVLLTVLIRFLGQKTKSASIAQ